MYYTYLNIKYPFLRACKNRNNFRKIKPYYINFTNTFNNLLFRYEKPAWNVSFTDEITHHLRQIFFIFLYLNIYTCFFLGMEAQVLQLTTEAENSISEDLQDSIQLRQKSFKDYISLRKEVDSTLLRIHQFGFIDCTLESFKKVDDSTYAARYFFGKRYRTIKIYYSKSDFTQKELTTISNTVTDTYFKLPFEDIETSLQKLNSLKKKTKC